MKSPIALAGDAVLYKKCKEVAVNDILKAPIQTVLNTISDILVSNDIAAGLAAPQVFKELRLFGIKLPEKSLTYTVVKAPKNFRIQPETPFFFINPVISFPDSEKVTKPEGCLSIPYYYGLIERFTSVKVKAYTKDAEQFEIIATKFLARLIQHEYDHLDGIMWFDRIKSTKDIVFSGIQNQD